MWLWLLMTHCQMLFGRVLHDIIHCCMSDKQAQIGVQVGFIENAFHCGSKLRLVGLCDNRWMQMAVLGGSYLQYCLPAYHLYNFCKERTTINLWDGLVDVDMPCTGSASMEQCTIQLQCVGP